MEDTSRSTPIEVKSALLAFLKDLEAEIGEGHLAVLQVRSTLGLPPRRGHPVERELAGIYGAIIHGPRRGVGRA